MKMFFLIGLYFCGVGVLQPTSHFFLSSEKIETMLTTDLKTANFGDWVKYGTRRYKRIKAGYTQKPTWDKGHYNSLNQLVGTNMSISAPVYERWIGRPPTVADMQAMTEQTALAIYKKNYWDKVKGDQIKSQLIANFVADMKSSGGGVKNLQKAVNSLGINISIDGDFGIQTLSAVNQLLEEGKVIQLNNAFRKYQIAFYKSLPNQAQNWYDSLDRDYPELYEVTTPVTGTKRGLSQSQIIYIVTGSILIAILGGYLIYTKVKKKK